MCDLWEDQEQREFLEMRGQPEPNWEICDGCGKKQHVGDWPLCSGNGKYGGHQPMIEYRPFVGWFDIGLGKQINSLADWNREMHNGGWDLRSKYDREEKPQGPSSKGISRAFNETIRKQFGGVLPVGNFLDDRD